MDFEGMKLCNAYNVLTELESGLQVKLGLEKSTGFFYIGDSDNFIGEKADEFIDWLDKELDSTLRKTVQNAKDGFQNFVKREPTPSRYILGMTKAKNGFSYEGYMNVLQDYFKTANTKYQSALKHIRELKTRIPLTDRIVKDAYPSIGEDKTIIIIIEGCESSGYWFKDEYESKTIETSEDNNEVAENE